MSEGGDLGFTGWDSLERRSRMAPDGVAAWYDAWRLQRSERRAEEARDRARMGREIRWMSGLIAAWSLAMGAAAVLAIRIVL